jgi:hypothetical protein
VLYLKIERPPPRGVEVGGPNELCSAAQFDFHHNASLEAEQDAPLAAFQLAAKVLRFRHVSPQQIHELARYTRLPLGPSRVRSSTARMRKDGNTMTNASDLTPNVNPMPEPFEVPPCSLNGADPKPLMDAEKVKVKKARARRAKDEREGRPPLPEDTKPAPAIPIQAKAEIKIEDIIADDSEDDDLAIEAPSGIPIRTRFPKADFVRVKPGVALLVNTIRLDEEDRRPNQLDVFILRRGLKRYVVEQLNHSVAKMAVRIGVTLHGHPFFLMHPVSSELSGNTYNSSRAEAISEAEKAWIKVRSDTVERRYKWSKRNPRLAPVEPIFPSDPFGAPSEPGAKNLFLRSLGTSLIEDENHRVMKRLRGEEEEEETGEADE